MTGEGAEDLSSYLARQRADVDRALERAVSGLESEVAPEIGAAIRHGVMSGGKRLRPMPCSISRSARA